MTELTMTQSLQIRSESLDEKKLLQAIEEQRWFAQAFGRLAHSVDAKHIKQNNKKDKQASTRPQEWTDARDSAKAATGHRKQDIPPKDAYNILAKHAYEGVGAKIISNHRTAIEEGKNRPRSDSYDDWDLFASHNTTSGGKNRSLVPHEDNKTILINDGVLEIGLQLFSGNKHDDPVLSIRADCTGRPAEIIKSSLKEDGPHSLGSWELVHQGRFGWKLHLTASRDTDISMNQIEYIVGIDLNLNRLAVAHIMDKDGNPAKFTDNSPVKVASSGLIKERREHYNKLQKVLQAKGKYSQSNLHKRSLHRFIKTYSRQIVADIVKNVPEPSKTLFVVEDLKGMVTPDDGDRLQSFPFHKFREGIEHAATKQDSPYESVDARNTSKTCPKCDHVDGDNRKRNEPCGICNSPDCFYCEACGYHNNNADVVAAMNIAERGREQFID